MLVGRDVIGMDPHKRSATIEVLDDDEQPLMAGRFGTDGEGYRLLLAAGRQRTLNGISVRTTFDMWTGSSQIVRIGWAFRARTSTAHRQERATAA